MPPIKRSPTKKILVTAGIFAIPVAIVLAVVLSLSHHQPSHTNPPPAGSAFNASLPSPNLPQKERNKLELYMQAQLYSLKAGQERAKDPYTQPKPQNDVLSSFTNATVPNRPALSTPPSNSSPADYDQTITERLHKIYGALGQATQMPSARSPVSEMAAPSTPTSPQIERLEH